MPLTWEQVRRGVEIADFTIANVPKLLVGHVDRFKAVLDSSQRIEDAVKKLQSMV